MKLRNILLFIFTVLVTISAISVTKDFVFAEDYTSVSIETLKGKLGSDNLAIIDSRREPDWEGSDLIIPSAIRGNLGDESTWASEIPKNTEIIVYCACPNEFTSSRVAQKLVDLGFTNVSVLLGGWNAWHRSGFPVVKK